MNLKNIIDWSNISIIFKKMAHPSHANIVDEAAEGLLNRRESSLSGDSDSFAQPSARVLGEPLSDRSSEMDEVVGLDIFMGYK